MVSERIGVFGGTFDPPHVGHLVAAINVADQLELSEVWFVVANIPWQKVGSRNISHVDHRMAMVELAVDRRPEFLASDVEIRHGGDSVTADTIEALTTARPNVEPIVIVGSDAAGGLGTWRRSEDLKQMARIAVVDRPGTTGDRPPGGFGYDVIPCPLMDISSSEIRDRCTRGLPIDFLVPDSVQGYIGSNTLYS